MATVVNFIDTTLQAAAARTVNLPTAQILLTPSAPAFHVAVDGTITPESITFTATQIDLDAPITFNAAGGTLTGIAAKSAVLAGADMPGTGATVIASATINGTTYTAPCTISKVRDAEGGTQGKDGDKTGTARLYQWSPTAPARPTGTSLFDWSTVSNGNYSKSDGWSVVAPSNPGTPLLRLYVASVGLTAAATAASSTVSYANATVEAWSQNGATGASGAQTRDATVYQWAATIPAGPAGTATFKWSDSSFGAAPNGWTLTPGAAPSLGMTLWAARRQVVDSAANSTTDFNWSTAAIMAIGYAGTNGGPGQQGASYVTAYIASSAIAANGAPAQTTGRASLPAANSSGLAGSWSAAVPTLADGQRMYQSDGIYDPITDKVTWSIPYWSSLKVATLSAITANLGAITGGSMNIGNGKFTVDAAGNVTMSSFILFDPNTGKAILQAGGVVNLDFLPAEVKNSNIAVGGRNLAEDSAFEGRLRPWTVSSPNTYGVGVEGANGAKNLVFDGAGDVYVDGGGPYIPVVPGKQYMLSYEYATATGGEIYGSSSYIYHNDGGITGLTLGPLNTGGGQVRYSMPWTCPAGVTGISFRFGIRSNGYAWMRVYNFDVQEGNKAAPWSPAPEDLRADAQAKADAAANWATSTAQSYAAAQAELARTNAQAYADGKVTAEEQRAINDAATKAEAARVAAVNAAAADATAKAAVAATMADYDKVKGRPDDTSNLVRKSSFDDNQMGQWQGVGTESKGGTNNERIPYTRTLLTRSRDALESGNYFPVTPNERIYFSVWLNTEATNYRGGFGMFLLNAAGQVVGYPLPCTLSAFSGWTYIEGSVVIPDGVGAVNACPWLQQDGPGDGFANGNWLRAAGMWIGRHARGATVGADSSNLKTGTGRPNLLEKNTLPTDLSTFSVYYSVPGEGLNIAKGATDFGVYSPGRRGAVWVHATGAPAAGTTVDIYRSDRVKIVPGQRYEFGVTLSTHRTTARIAVAWYDASGNYITEHGGNDVTNSFWNINTEALPSRSVLLITPPAAARSAMVFVRQVHYGEADPYTFASQWYAAEALPGQTEPSPYSASPLEARDMAESAQAGLADKLSQTAGGVMQGQTTLQSSGAIVAGNASWGAPGYGGTGTVMSPYGFACVQNGVPKLAMSVSGDIFYAGELRGAYGTFGAVRIEGGGTITSGAYTSFASPPAGGGTGWAMTPQGFTIGNYNDGRFVTLYSYGDIEAPGFKLINKQVTLTNPIIINPILPSFTVSITNSINQYNWTVSRQNADAFVGTYVASISGSSANAASYNWTVSGPWPCWLVSNGGANQVQLHINMKGGAPLAGDQADFYIACSVTRDGTTQNTQRLVTVTAS